MSNLNESLRDWITFNLDYHPDLEAVELVTMGEAGDLVPPFFGIMETAAEAYKQDNVMLAGVSTYELTCELHTVAAAEEDAGTLPETERGWRTDLYNILGNRAAIDHINGLNGWVVFDIRMGGPTTEASDGRRVSRWVLQIVAAPTTT